MKVLVPREREPGETRVALVPDTLAKLQRLGAEVWVEAGAGQAAHYEDSAYQAAGASLSPDGDSLWASAGLVVKVSPPRPDEVARLTPGTVLISFLDPLGNPTLIHRLAEAGVTSFALEMVPRSSRAQAMDALSSQASLAGYKAVLLGASYLPRFFPMLTTAAGTIPPAKVLVLGAGVAGLQAIATARRLGAVVEAFDIRPQVKEEVQSLGAKFLEIPLEEETEGGGGYAKEVSSDSQERTRQFLTDSVHKADVVITTAQVPGRPAPLLVSEDMVAGMKPGSVVVDLAAAGGGNCACTDAGATVQAHGVTILGPLNLPATLPVHASQMLSRNLLALLTLLLKEGQVNLDFSDDIIATTCLTHAGEIRNARVRDLVSQIHALERS
ncbi:MAG: Re/Si-specific NAD(P)(+) transhydrogenase subunit alpha [Gloeomargaritaceae cyanobacterium C42_A2020_066]|nr:Re/Si-specific NAD(P)(+) transhydrogenase subunit alpha [Gloeomargaritaceae cyanobacterium C42_A2020_066]